MEVTFALHTFEPDKEEAIAYDFDDRNHLIIREGTEISAEQKVQEEMAGEKELGMVRSIL